MAQRTKQTAIVRPERMAQELELFMQGKTYDQIVQIVNAGKPEEDHITDSALYHDLSKALKIWRQRNLDNVDIIMARELDRLDRLENEYWDAWKRSLDPESIEETVTITGSGFGKYGDTNLSSSEKRKRERQRHGNVDYLNGIQKVIELRYRILNLGQSRTVNINWRQEASRAGIDPDSIVDAITAHFVEASYKEGDQEVPLLEDVN